MAIANNHPSWKHDLKKKIARPTPDTERNHFTMSKEKKWERENTIRPDLIVILKKIEYKNSMEEKKNGIIGIYKISTWVIWSTEIFKVVDKVGKFASLIDLFTSTHDGFGQGPRTAAEDTNLAHVAVLLLYKLQEGRHVRPTEVVHRLQSSKHTPLGDALKVVLTNVEHRCAQIKLVEELRDENVHL